jgi:Uma2 family endonuclease
MSMSVLDEAIDQEPPPRPEVPEGFEMVNGQLREVLVSTESSRVSGTVFFALKTHCVARQPGWVFPEGTSFRCFPNEDRRTRRADTAFIALDRMPPATYRDEGHCTTVPDLVVEVISPNDLAYDLDEKLEDWLGAGVKVVWIINTHARTVRVHRADGTTDYLRATATLTAPDLLPGFACPVAELFRLPGTAGTGG